MNRHEKAMFGVLREHYTPERGYQLIPQVANATGAGQTRTADAICMQVWPSRGLTLHGFEFKAHRADWLHELKRPEKAEDIAGYCHQWTIVAPDGVVDLSELPPAWGLIQVVDGKRLKFSRHAPQREPQKPLDLAFLAAIFRRFQREDIDASSAQIEAAVQRGAKAERGRMEMEERHAQRENDRLKERIERFEERTGESFNGFDPPERFAEALRIATQQGQIEQRLRRARETLHAATKQIDGVLDEEHHHA